MFPMMVSIAPVIAAQAAVTNMQTVLMIQQQQAAAELEHVYDMWVAGELD